MWNPFRGLMLDKKPIIVWSIAFVIPILLLFTFIFMKDLIHSQTLHSQSYRSSSPNHQLHDRCHSIGNNTRLLICLGTEITSIRDKISATLVGTELRRNPALMQLETEAQVNFSQYVSSTCAANSLIYDGGSLQNVVAASCTRDFLEERLVELKATIDEWNI